jgi:hypothetical protein
MLCRQETTTRAQHSSDSGRRMEGQKGERRKRRSVECEEGRSRGCRRRRRGVSAPPAELSAAAAAAGSTLV